MTDIPRPGLPRRLAAIIYDTLLVLPLVMAAVALTIGGMALATYLHTLATGNAGGVQHGGALPPWLVQLLCAATVLGFYCHFWRKGGQSLGMRAWRLRLRNTSGGDVTLSQCLVRCLAAALSLLPAGLGYWWCLVDPRRRCWHDHLSGTELELLPKDRR